MKRKEKSSTMNSVLTALLAIFTCVFFFSVGVISGKTWSDRDYKVRHIENDSHMKAAMDDNEPLGDEMTQKEVELLTQRALKEAKAEQPSMEPEEDSAEEQLAQTEAAEQDPNSRKMASADETVESQDSEKPKDEKAEPLGREASTAMKAKAKKSGQRKVSSVRPTPSVPKPKSIEYTVQVAAYKSLKEAEAHSQKLIDKGFPAFPVKAMINKKLWYRVSIGSFKSRKQAMKYERNLKKQAVVNSTFVQKITRLK